MQLLLDTHILYWTLYDQGRQPASAKRLIVEADAVFVSAASFWEVAIKVKLGKLKADLDEMIASIEPAGFVELPIIARHSVQVASLPLHHTDPFDRMLVAQAMSESLYLLTADRRLSQYSSLVIRV